MSRFRLALLVAATLAATSCGDAVNGPDRAEPTRLRLTVILPQPGVAALPSRLNSLPAIRCRPAWAAASWARTRPATEHSSVRARAV